MKDPTFRAHVFNTRAVLTSYDLDLVVTFKKLVRDALFSGWHPPGIVVKSL